MVRSLLISSDYQNHRKIRHGPVLLCPMEKKKLDLSGFTQTIDVDEALSKLDLPHFYKLKKELDKRCGKKRGILKMPDLYEEEKATEKFLKATMTPCPRCQTYVEKNMGCNHVCLVFLVQQI